MGEVNCDYRIPFGVCCGRRIVQPVFRRQQTCYELSTATVGRNVFSELGSNVPAAATGFGTTCPKLIYWLVPRYGLRNSRVDVPFTGAAASWSSLLLFHIGCSVYSRYNTLSRFILRTQMK